MTLQIHGLKTLESLVSECAKTLRGLLEDNERLLKASAKLEAENKSLKEQVRRLSSETASQAKLRARLLKISQKLEKIG